MKIIASTLALLATLSSATKILRGSADEFQDLLKDKKKDDGATDDGLHVPTRP